MQTQKLASLAAILGGAVALATAADAQETLTLQTITSTGTNTSQGAAQTIEAIGAGLALHTDVSDSSAVDDALAQVERDLGPIDILVNNAGAVGAAHLERVMPLLETQRLEALSGGPPIEEGKLFTARPSNITPDPETGMASGATRKSGSPSAKASVRPTPRMAAR